MFVPAALWNLCGSWNETAWRKRFLLPTSASFELTKYAAALEYVAYFIGLYPDRSDLGVSSVDPDIGDLFDMATGLSKPVLDRDRFRVELCCRGGVSHAVTDQDAD